MTTYVMSVLVGQYDEFIIAGDWVLKGVDKECPGNFIIEKNVPGPADDGRTVYIGDPVEPKMFIPGTIRRPLRKYAEARFLDSLSLQNIVTDESAHSVHSSLSRMCHTKFAYATFKVESLFCTSNKRTFALRLHTRFRGKQLKQYVEWLLQIRRGKRKLTRPSGFTEREIPEGTLPQSPDLWWDTQNDTLFSFDKNYMARLPQHLGVSFSIIEGNSYAGALQHRSGRRMTNYEEPFHG